MSFPLYIYILVNKLKRSFADNIIGHRLPPSLVSIILYVFISKTFRACIDRLFFVLIKKNFDLLNLR